MPNYNESPRAAYYREPKVFGLTITPEDDVRWQDTIAANCGAQDIYNLWMDPDTTDPATRQRLTAMLTAPYGHRLDFTMPEEDVSLPAVVGPPEEWQRNGSLRERLRNRPGLAIELAHGVSFWLDQIPPTAPYLHDEASSVHSYQRAIYELLPAVSSNRALADSLFRHFSITSLAARKHFDEPPDYSPVRCMLLDQKIPYEYRRISLAKWIDAASPMDYSDMEKRSALKQLTAFMGEWVTSKALDPLLHKHLVDSLETGALPSRPYCEATKLSQVVERLTDSRLAYTVSRRHVLFEAAADDPYVFSIQNGKDYFFTTWLQKAATAAGDGRLLGRTSQLLQAETALQILRTIKERPRGYDSTSGTL